MIPKELVPLPSSDASSSSMKWITARRCDPGHGRECRKGLTDDKGHCCPEVMIIAQFICHRTAGLIETAGKIFPHIVEED